MQQTKPQEECLPYPLDLFPIYDFWKEALIKHLEEEGALKISDSSLLVSAFFLLKEG